MFNPLEVVGTLVGLLYLWLELKASVWLWLTGVIMPAIYVVVYYQAGLYADFGMQIYYLLAGGYGLYSWLKPSGTTVKPSGTTISPSSCSCRSLLLLTLIALVLWLLLGTFLHECTNSTVPYLDGFTTALSVVGLWMLSKKYIEQWWVWVAVDFVSSGLYIYKGIYATAMLYALYTIIAVFGYYKWKKLMLSY